MKARQRVLDPRDSTPTIRTNLPWGLAWMANQKKTFMEMSIETGIKGIVTPLHPGAERFWREMGML